MTLGSLLAAAGASHERQLRINPDTECCLQDMPVMPGGESILQFQGGQQPTNRQSGRLIGWFETCGRLASRITYTWCRLRTFHYPGSERAKYPQQNTLKKSTKKEHR
jgi:hypothetical protein